MAQYIYDESGNRYRREKDDGPGGGAVLLLLALAVLIAFAPGMVISSLFASFIDTSLWAWIWSVVFSVGFFFLIYWFYWASINNGNPWKWTIWTYLDIIGFIHCAAFRFGSK